MQALMIPDSTAFHPDYLLESLARQLQQQGKTVLSPQQYLMNDGGLALGQALIAAGKKTGLNQVDWRSWSETSAPF